LQLIWSQKSGDCGPEHLVLWVATISGTEMNRYFTSQDQDRIFKGDQTRNINQAMREGFSGGRLIERIGQIHFGGPDAPIDGGASDVHGRLTLQTYGKELAANYQKALSKSGQTCFAGGSGSGSGKATGKLVDPAPGYPITSGFGPRKSPCAGCSSYHPAVDIGTPPNTAIQSSDGGTVIGAEWWDGYGYTVVIDHGNGIKTRYSHLNRIDVKVGQKVDRGQRIALSGATGAGTGPHLDFGVYRYQGSDWRTPKGAAIDPRNVINF
jgi:murein DD-endopeptidase MepM/ murein hydrolase activator NlpD